MRRQNSPLSSYIGQMKSCKNDQSKPPAWFTELDLTIGYYRFEYNTVPTPQLITEMRHLMPVPSVVVEKQKTGA
jgi:hypothetical protein